MKIAALDLDGVLVEYPKAWVDFINEKLESGYNNLNEAKKSVSFQQYKELKLKYRLSGIKAKLPLITGAAELTQKLRTAGYIIIILTARPIYEIPEVFRDTLFWLKSNKIAYDLIFAGADKHIKILKYFPKLDFMVEDNAEIANKTAQLGYKVFLLDSEYNQQQILDSVTRIKKLSDIEVV